VQYWVRIASQRWKTQRNAMSRETFRYREFLRSMEMPEEFIELHRKTTLPIVWVPLDTAANATVLPQNRNPK